MDPLDFSSTVDIVWWYFGFSPEWDFWIVVLKTLGRFTETLALGASFSPLGLKPPDGGALFYQKIKKNITCWQSL